MDKIKSWIPFLIPLLVLLFSPLPAWMPASSPILTPRFSSFHLPFVFLNHYFITSLQCFFCISWYDDMIFILCCVYVAYHVNWFVNIEPKIVGTPLPRSGLPCWESYCGALVPSSLEGTCEAKISLLILSDHTWVWVQPNCVSALTANLEVAHTL